MKFVRTKSLCNGCPFEIRNKVHGQMDGENPRIAFLGEAPGETEDFKGEPFVGGAGRWLKNATKEAGLMWHKVWKTNVICCRPPKNDIVCEDSREAIARCSGGLTQELEYLKKQGVKVIVPLGNTAIEALNITGMITKVRGSVYELENGLVAVPTFHPSFIMRGQVKEQGTWVNDIAKAKQISYDGWKPPKERFNLNPSIKDVKEFRAAAIGNNYTLAVDVETTSLIPEKAKIIMVGIAWSPEDAIVIPFWRNNTRGDSALTEYWPSDKQEREVINILTELFERCPTVYQNALFDMRHLADKGMRPRLFGDDIMLLHHAGSPELPHNLGYIVSQFGATPYWKEVVLGGEEAMSRIPDPVLRQYNARDCVVIHQVLPKLKEAVRQNETMTTYEKYSKPLVHPVMEMIENGMLLDRKAQNKLKRDYKNKVEESERSIRELLTLPESFNLDSPIDVKYLVYGAVPPKVERARKEIEKYEENPKLRKDTKKYRDLQTTLEVFEGTRPITLPTSFTPGRTKAGSKAFDKEARVSISRACSNRIERIKTLKNKKSIENTRTEKTDLERTLKAMSLFRDYQDARKILGTFLDYPVAADGRVHFQYKIHGTHTGRLSSGGKGTPGNAQNIPKPCRKMFIAQDGCTFVQADFSNLELRVLAAVSRDRVLQAIFDRNLNVHTENCKLLFGIDELHPDWDAARRACKVYIFGRNYGGTVEGVYKKVINDVPELGLTLKRFTAIDAEYRQAHPAYTKWYNETVHEVRVHRALRNAFGRKRIFLGGDNEIVREGLNFPIQSTAADIMNAGLIGLHQDLQAKRLDDDPAWCRVKLVGTVHDSIMLEVPNELRDETVGLIKTNLERKHIINDEEWTFPVDIEIGSGWGALQAYAKEDEV